MLQVVVVASGSEDSKPLISHFAVSVLSLELACVAISLWKHYVERKGNYFIEVTRRICSLVNWHFMPLVRHSVQELVPVASHWKGFRQKCSFQALRGKGKVLLLFAPCKHHNLGLYVCAERAVSMRQMLKLTGQDMKLRWLKDEVARGR